MSNENGSSNKSGGGNLLLLLGVILLALVAFAPDELHVFSDWLMELRILSPSADPVINVIIPPVDLGPVVEQLGQQTEVLRLQQQELQRGNDCVRAVQDTGALSRLVRSVFGFPICE